MTLKLYVCILLQMVSKGNSVSCSNTPQIRPRNGREGLLHNNHRLHRGGQQKQESHNSNNALPSPTRSEEHQYDIPFSHLGNSNGAVEKHINNDDDIDPDYDEMMVNNSSQHGNLGSAAVLLPKSSTKANKAPWNNLSSDRNRQRRENNSPIAGLESVGTLWGGSTLLQPRLISGETGGTPLIAKHNNLEGGQRWSGSDRSIDTSVYSGTCMQRNMSYVSMYGR